MMKKRIFHHLCHLFQNKNIFSYQKLCRVDDRIFDSLFNNFKTLLNDQNNYQRRDQVI